MPNIALITRKTTSSCSRIIDQMHNKYFRAHMSEEEKLAAEESLFEAYAQPIELYNILQRRAIENPLFLQRSLKYQTEAKHQRRIQMTFSLSGTRDAASEQTQKLFPLYVMLARLDSSKPTAEHTTEIICKYSRVCLLTGFDGDSQGQANFLLPRMDKLALKSKLEPLAILFFSFAGSQNSQFGIDSSKNHSGPYLWSKIPLESLYSSSWQKYPNMNLGHKVKSVSLVEMQPCFLETEFISEKESRVVIQFPSNPCTSSSPQQVQVTITAQEVGAMENPPYSSSFSFDGIPSFSAVFPINKLRKGLVVFNYRYYNNKLQEPEVTGDFRCPFCLVKCGSYKGLECHMPSTHDRFNYEFWVNQEYPAVDVSLKSETTIDEFFKIPINKGEPNARLEQCPISSKQSRRRKQKTPVRNQRQAPLTYDADSVKSEKSQMPPKGAELSSQTVPPGNVSLKIETMITEINEDVNPNARLEPYSFSSKKFRRRKQKTPVRISSQGPDHKTDDADFVKSGKSQISPGGAESSRQTDSPGNMSLMIEAMFTEFFKFQINEGDPNTRVNLTRTLSFLCPSSSKKSRRRKQKTPVRNPRPGPLKAYEADTVKSEKSQISPEELQIKHMWISFAKENRVFEDGRLPWGCDQFSKLHGPFMVRNPYMLWCWKKYTWTQMIYGRLDYRTLKNCMEFLEQLPK